MNCLSVTYDPVNANGFPNIWKNEVDEPTEAFEAAGLAEEVAVLEEAELVVDDRPDNKRV
jgi:hypothetical protein